MKFTMGLSDLQEIVKRTRAVLRKESSMTFLRFDVRQNEVKITGISPDINIIMMFLADAKGNDSFLISAQKVFQVIMKIGGENITIIHNEKGVRLIGEDVKMDFQNVGLLGCPLLSEVKDPYVTISTDSQDLLEGVRRCGHALSTRDQNIPVILRSFYLEVVEEAIRVTTTDTRRIAISGPEDPPLASVTIEGNVLSSVADFLKGPCDIKKSEDYYEISDQYMILRGITSSGKYPLLSPFFQEEYPYHIRCNRKELLMKTEIVSCFHKLLYFSFTNDEIVLKSVPGVNGTMEASIPCVSNDYLTFCINARYLIDAVSSASSEEITIFCLDSLHPILLKEEGFQEIIMPVSQEKES